MSIVLDGISQRVDYSGSNYDFSNSAASISMWVTTFRNNTNQWFFRQRGTASDTDYFRISNNTSGYIIVNFTGAVGNRTRSTNSVLTQGIWNHICVTYPLSKIGADVSIYINGLAASYTTTADITTYSSNTAGIISLGGRTLDNTRNFMGMMTCVGCWNRILAYDEILQLYSGAEPYRIGYGLVHQFPLQNHYRDLTGGANSTNYGAALSIREPRCLHRYIPPCFLGISAVPSGIKSIFGHTGYGPIGSRLIRGAA